MKKTPFFLLILGFLFFLVLLFFSYARHRDEEVYTADDTRFADDVVLQACKLEITDDDGNHLVQDEKTALDSCVAGYKSKSN